MPDPMEILARHKDTMRGRFLEVVRQDVHVPEVPKDPEQALRLGIQQGLIAGYQAGLVDGARLGLDVGFETLEALLSQPVIFGPPGWA